MKLVLRIIALLLAGTAQAQPQTVWRCGADGRSYSDSPCTAGRVVAVADARNAAQVQSAREVLARDRALARELARERQARERQAGAGGSGLAGIKPAPTARITPAVARRKPAKPQRPFEARGISPATAAVSR